MQEAIEMRDTLQDLLEQYIRENEKDQISKITKEGETVCEKHYITLENFEAVDEEDDDENI